MTHTNSTNGKVLVHPTLRLITDKNAQLFRLEIRNYETIIEVLGPEAVVIAFSAFRKLLCDALTHTGMVSGCSERWLEVTSWLPSANSKGSSDRGSREWLIAIARAFSLQPQNSGDGPFHLDIAVVSSQRIAKQSNKNRSLLTGGPAPRASTEEAKRNFCADMAIVSAALASIGSVPASTAKNASSDTLNVEIGWRPIARSGLRGCPAFYEAGLILIRSDGKFVEPEAVFAAARRLGLVHLLDQHLVSSAVDELQRSAGSVALTVSVDPETLSGGQFWDGIVKRLCSGPVIASDLIIAIKGVATSGFEPKAREAISKLKAVGCRTAFGNFGLSGPSLGDVAAFAPDFVIVDRHFLSARFRDQFGTGPIFHLACLARAMGAEVVVDGVDCADTAALVEEVGASLQKGAWCGGLRFFRSWAERAEKPAAYEAPNVLQMKL